MINMDLFSKRKKESEKKPEAEKSFSIDDIHSIVDKKTVEKETPVIGSELKDEDINKDSDPSRNVVPVNYIEKVSTFNVTRAILYLTVLGIIGIIFFTQYTLPSPSFLLLVWFFGTMCFLPLGLVIGWLFLNQDIRVLILRRFRGKNYGIVHFVHRGGQRMGTRIKNFDDDIIIQDTKMWILQNDGIYYMDRNRNMIKHAAINPQQIKTLPANIPVLYLDLDTMTPLTFHKQQTKSNPQEVGSTILGYVYNQIAKVLYLKKGMQIFFIIMIALTVINLVIGIQMASWLDEIEKEIPKIEQQLSRLGEILSALNMTIPNNNYSFPYPNINLPGG